MKRNTRGSRNGMSDLAEDAKALLAATEDVAGYKVERARKRLSAALDRGKSCGDELIDTTADLAEDNIRELFDRITAALDHGKEIYDDVHDDVIEKVKTADHAVRNKPYQVMGIALGIGAIVGFLVSCRNSRNDR